jgi:hypothetical protein
MRKGAIFPLILIACMGIASHSANAGSAVAWDGKKELSAAYGGPVEREKLRALETARRKGGANIRIVAATDTVGYAAIAVAYKPSGHGSIIGVSLGNHSAREAEAQAIDDCLKANGKNPKVRWRWLDRTSLPGERLGMVQSRLRG